MNARAQRFCEDPPAIPAAVLPGWSGITGLMSLIYKAIEEVEWFGKRGHFVCGGQCFRQEAMMRLLTYCRVTGAHSAAQIAEKLVEDRAAKFLCDGAAPDGETVTRFAELQPDALDACVRGVWARSASLRFTHSEPHGVPIDSCPAEAIDRWLAPLRPPSHPFEEHRGILLVEFAHKMP